MTILIYTVHKNTIQKKQFSLDNNEKCFFPQFKVLRQYIVI